MSPSTPKTTEKNLLSFLISQNLFVHPSEILAKLFSEWDRPKSLISCEEILSEPLSWKGCEKSLSVNPKLGFSFLLLSTAANLQDFAGKKSWHEQIPRLVSKQSHAVVDTWSLRKQDFGALFTHEPSTSQNIWKCLKDFVAWGRARNFRHFKFEFASNFSIPMCACRR